MIHKVSVLMFNGLWIVGLRRFLLKKACYRFHLSMLVSHRIMLLWIVFAAPLVLLLALLFLHPHFFQDVRYVRCKLKVRRKIAEHYEGNYLILDRFQEVVDMQPHKPFIRFKDESYTYRDADELSSKAARVFLQSGRVKQGDVVALLLGNKPIFLFLWLGLLKIGCSVAFLNYNIRSKSLLHCFSRCGAKTLVTDEGIRDDWVFSTLGNKGALVLKTSKSAILYEDKNNMSLNAFQCQHRSQNDLCIIPIMDKVRLCHSWCAEDAL